MEVQIRRLATDGAPIAIGEGCRAQALVYPGIGSQFRSMHHIEIPAARRTDELRHPASEAAYFVVQGAGTIVDGDTGESFAIRQGKMIHLDAGTRYRIAADASGTMIVIGGPCPPDGGLYAGQ